MALGSRIDDASLAYRLEMPLTDVTASCNNTLDSRWDARVARAQPAEAALAISGDNAYYHDIRPVWFRYARSAGNRYKSTS